MNSGGRDESRRWTPKYDYTRSCFLILLIIAEMSYATDRNRSSSTLFDFSKIIKIDDILNSIISNRTDCQQIARIFLARIRLYNGRLGAVTVLNYRGAIADARRLDSYRKRNRGRLFGRLHCVPTLIKDNILVAGLPTTLGLWVFSNSTARTDASAVWRLKTEGALILGKANLAPFSFGLKSPDEGSEITGLCQNPYAVGGGPIARVYGSSCGNAVGQAAQLAVIGLATDTAGSATWPAAVCGLVSVRPIHKKRRSDGFFPLLTNAGDTIAPMAATVSDAVLLLDIILATNRSSRDIGGEKYKIGVIRDLLFSSPASEINFTRADGFTRPYYVDPEIFTAAKKFLTRISSNGGVTVVNLTISLHSFTEQIHSIHRAWTDVFSCVPRWIDAFFKKYPFLVKTKNAAKYVRSFEDVLGLDGIPSHYRRYFEMFSKHTSHCLPSLRRLRKARSSAKRTLQRLIFDADKVDVIAYPRPHSFSSALSPADSILMLDPAGALGFPAMNIPIGYSGQKSISGDRRRYSPGNPIGMYLMTRPRKFKAMLEVAQVYENLKSPDADASYLPPEFV